LVWKAWTDPKYVKQWWGPKGFTAPFCEMDFRVGGKFLCCMRAPDGQEFWNGGEYHEIVLHEKIVVRIQIEGVPEFGLGLGPALQAHVRFVYTPLSIGSDGKNLRAE
jgi:uncharacterized protein YndB with AHSA1/START domain